MTSAQVNGAVADEDEDEAPKSKMGMPIELYDMVAAAAKTQDIAVSAFIRKTVAEAVGFTGILTRRASRAGDDLTPEQRTARNKERADRKRKLFKLLMAKYEAGEFGDIDLDEDEDDE